MTRNWHTPQRAPTPAELAAWADGELDEDAAARVCAWLASNPDVAAETDAHSRLLGLFRDSPPADPTPAAWNSTLERIARGTRNRHRWQAFAWASIAAAVLVAVVGAGILLPRPVRPPTIAKNTVRLDAEDDNDEPFAVAVAAEVNILHMDARDADRVMLGRPLLDPFDFVSSDDIQVVEVEPDWDEGNMPRLRNGVRVPMVVVARTDRTPNEGDEP